MPSLSDAIKHTKKSVVAIGYKINSNQLKIIGSGFAVSTDGIIASAAHLYEQVPVEHKTDIGAMVMTNEEANGLETYSWLPLKLIEEKINKENDLALFQLSGYEQSLLTPMELGDSDATQAGEEVYFIGFPYAVDLLNEGFGLTLIVNKGIISTIKRDGINPDHKRNWIIVDAISNPGNSGCPLIGAENNKVIGVMSISFRKQSQINKELDIREPMHIAGARPVNLLKELMD
jgi:S1-C subfamily serine protease